jgi:hypothetical protein
MPTPTGHTFPTANPTMSASVDTVSKLMIALTPTQAARRISPIVAMPTDDRHEDDWGEHQLDRIDEGISERLERDRKLRCCIAKRDADEHLTV